MKILITGTHFTPAQAVIEELKEEEIVYVGRNYTQEGFKGLSAESVVLPKLGVKFIPILAGRIRIIWDFYTIWSFIKIPIGFIQAFYVVFKEQPSVVLSFGGYTSVPVIFGAWLLSIPIIVHEQTLVSGMANSICNLFANKIAVSFDKKYQYKNKKIILTGNPIRSELFNSSDNIPKQMQDVFKLKQKEKLPLIYITGGNQGSDIINKNVKEILDELTKDALVIHQTGDSKANFFEILSNYKSGLKFSERYLVKKWFEAFEVSKIFNMADLAVSRAGINTLTELSFFCIPAIVIPFPNLFKDEQNINAKFFEGLGLCQIISQNNLTPEQLLNSVAQTLKNLEKYKNLAKNASAVVIRDAAKRLALETVLLVKDE